MFLPSFITIQTFLGQPAISNTMSWSEFLFQELLTADCLYFVVFGMLLWILHWCLVFIQVVLGEACEQFRNTGECCSMCPAGTGMASSCGHEDTECQPCQDGEHFHICVFWKYESLLPSLFNVFIIDKHHFKYLTGFSFSDSEGLAACRLCARCPMGISELARCTTKQDTQCECGEHFFLWRDGNSTSGLCNSCSMCGKGSGVVRPCGPLGNTVCKRCQPGTYSKERSDMKPCIPCSRCGQDEVEIRSCQPDSDTVCMGERNLHNI